ncbi:MAG: hypothetical protein ACP5GI_07995 [Sulfolobales archaeon]
MKVELWARVTQSGWSPVIWIPMKRGPESDEAKGRGLDTKLFKLNKTRTPLCISDLLPALRGEACCFIVIVYYQSFNFLLE